MQIHLSRALPVSRDAAWRTFVDLQRWPRWSPWTMRFVDEPRFERGAEFQVVVPAPAMPWVELCFPCRVTALEAPGRIRWDGAIFGVRGYHQFAFEPTHCGCRVLSEERFFGLSAQLLRPARGAFVRRVEGFLDDFAAALAAAEG